MTAIKSFGLGLLSLLKGMAVTLRTFFTKPVTERYPAAEPELPEAFRGVIELVRDPQTGHHRCNSCMTCMRICPSQCITVAGEKVAGVKGKRPTQFEVQFTLCSLCGLCVEACSVSALQHSRRYDQAGYRPDEWNYDLLAPYRDGEEAYRDLLRKQLEEANAKKKAKAEAAAKKKAAEEIAAQAEADEDCETGEAEEA